MTSGLMQNYGEGETDFLPGSNQVDYVESLVYLSYCITGR